MPRTNRILDETENNLLSVEIGERMTADDYQSIFGAAAEKIFANFSDARLILKYTKPFLGWDVDAAEMDLGILTSKGGRIAKIALVGPPDNVLKKWQTLAPVLGEVRIFKSGEYMAAVTWAKTG